MAQKIIKLGSILSEILKDTNSNFTELYNAVATIQEELLDGGGRAIVYSSAQAMADGLNANKDEAGNTITLSVGDEIYILDENTPDFWISAVAQSADTNSVPTEWEENVGYRFGYYTIRVVKSKIIDEDLIGKIKDVLVNDVSVVDENGIARIYIDDKTGAEYIEVSASDEAWTTKTINGTTYDALTLAETDTTVEMLNSAGQAVVTQTIRADGNIYLCVLNKMDCVLRKIGGNYVKVNGESGGGTKKYLHCVRLRTNNPATEETEKDEYGIFFKRRFTLYNTKIYIISENKNPISSLSGLEILDMSNGVLNCVEEEYENLGEVDSEDVLLNSNTYSFPIFNLSKIGDALIIFASGTKTNVEIEKASLSNLISVGEGTDVNVYDIPIIVEATFSNNYKNFNVYFYPTNYSVESDTVTEI